MQQKADFGKIKIAKPQRLKQTNDDDCGLFVVHYVEKILGLVELYAERDSLANLDDQRFPVEEVFCVYVCLCCLKVNAKRCDLRVACFVLGMACNQRAPGAAEVSIFLKNSSVDPCIKLRSSGPVLILRHGEDQCCSHIQPTLVLLSLYKSFAAGHARYW